MQDAIFVWIPKNGGHSVFRALKKHGFKKILPRKNGEYIDPVDSGRVTFGHFDIAKLLEDGLITESFYRRAFKFCFTRNPWARAVSVCHAVKSNGEELTFPEFVGHLCNMAVEPLGLYDWLYMSPAQPQYRWITRHALEPTTGDTFSQNGYLVDFIGRVETFQDDFDTVCTHLNVPTTKLSFSNKGKYDMKWPDYYTDADTIRVVSNFYAGDIRRFDYNMPVKLRSICDQEYEQAS
jgi:hypothetical protein